MTANNFEYSVSVDIGTFVPSQITPYISKARWIAELEREFAELLFITRIPTGELKGDFNEWIKTQALSPLQGIYQCVQLAARGSPLPWDRDGQQEKANNDKRVAS